MYEVPYVMRASPAPALPLCDSIEPSFNCLVSQYFAWSPTGCALLIDARRSGDCDTEVSVKARLCSAYRLNVR